MVFALPLLVVLFSLGIALKSLNLSEMNAESWQRWWMGINALWCYFMLPLFIALISSSINSTEHKHEGWRLMLALPVNINLFYSMKLLLGWLLTVGSMLMLWLFSLLAAQVMIMVGASADLSYGSILLFSIPSIAIAVLPVMVIQHAISWRFSNMIIPLAVGVVATMGIVQIGSSQYWVYFPWSYMLTSALGSTAESQHLAIQLSAGLACLLFIFNLKLVAKNKRAG